MTNTEIIDFYLFVVHGTCYEDDATETELFDDTASFWRGLPGCPEDLKTSLLTTASPFHKEKSSYPLKGLLGDRITYDFSQEIEGIKIDSWGCPFLMGQSMLLLLNSYFESQAERIGGAEKIGMLEKSLECPTGKLGNTKLICVKGVRREEREEKAIALYTELAGQAPLRQEKGRFLDSDVFEFWDTSKNYSWTKINTPEKNISTMFAFVDNNLFEENFPRFCMSFLRFFALKYEAFHCIRGFNHFFCRLNNAKPDFVNKPLLEKAIEKGVVFIEDRISILTMQFDLLRNSLTTFVPADVDFLILSLEELSYWRDVINNFQIDKPGL